MECEYCKKEIHTPIVEKGRQLLYVYCSQECYSKSIEWKSISGHCEQHCKNKTVSCFCCEENNDCDCELIKDK